MTGFNNIYTKYLLPRVILSLRKGLAKYLSCIQNLVQPIVKIAQSDIL